MSMGSPFCCAECLEPVKLSIDASWVSTVSCPVCENSDTLFNVSKQADAYIAAWIGGEIARDDGETCKQPAPRRFRFIPSAFARRKRARAFREAP